jgi:hypothetical protein
MHAGREGKRQTVLSSFKHLPVLAQVLVQQYGNTVFHGPHQKTTSQSGPAMAGNTVPAIISSVVRERGFTLGYLGHPAHYKNPLRSPRHFAI